VLKRFLNCSADPFSVAILRNWRDERNWNGEPTPHLKSESRISRSDIYRKLQGIGQALALLGEQGKVKGFFNNVANADKLGAMVEDIRDAMMTTRFVH
jgi:hypothetical protein